MRVLRRGRGESTHNSRHDAVTVRGFLGVFARNRVPSKPLVRGSSPLGRASEIVDEVGDLENARGNRVATARALLEAVAVGREEPAWEHAKALARSVLDDQRVVLAKAVLDAGPFA